MRRSWAGSLRHAQQTVIPTFRAKYKPRERWPHAGGRFQLSGSLADPTRRTVAHQVAAKLALARGCRAPRWSPLRNRGAAGLVGGRPDRERAPTTRHEDSRLRSRHPHPRSAHRAPPRRPGSPARVGLVAGSGRAFAATSHKRVRAGIERVSPNDLRRTYASWLVNAGVPLQQVARLLGHKSTRMVDLVCGKLSTRR
ncbi:MAG: tyrosine-type recombinase/integrase [Kofleriaceae bacterium]|nr:tyrosine-type recombinase/integrase [Kofleriaceae bacterium]